MVISMDYEDIYGETLEKLIDFCVNLGDRMTLTQSTYCWMTKEEEDKAREKQAERFKEEDVQRRSMYQTDPEYQKRINDFCGGEQEALEYFKEIYQQELEILTNIQSEEEIKQMQKEHPEFPIPRFYKTIEEINAHVQTECAGLPYDGREVTFSSACTTSGGAMIVYSFHLNEKMSGLLKQMKDLYKPVISKKEFWLDDPTIYRMEDVLLSICSHEQYGTLRISDEEYKTFQTLGIPHSCEK